MGLKIRYHYICDFCFEEVRPPREYEFDVIPFEDFIPKPDPCWTAIGRLMACEKCFQIAKDAMTEKGNLCGSHS